MESPLHNAGGWLARRARTSSGRLAVADDVRRLDYAALESRSARCATLLARAGVGRGDRVALLLGNRSAYLEAVFAAARLGAVAVPVNARLTAREIRGIFDDCAPRAVLHEARLADALDTACEGLSSPPEWRLACGGEFDDYERALLNAPARESIEPVGPDHPMILMYTSGTTGVPKGALLPHRKTLYNSLNAQLFFDLTRADRVLVPVPLFHSYGLTILAIPTLYAGGAVVLHPRFDADATWHTVERERISFFGGVPTQYHALLEALERDPGRHDLRSLRFLFTAGAAIPVELVRAFDRHGLKLLQGFGQTETSILCCLEARDALRKAGSVGRPVFHADVRVVSLEGLDGPPETWKEADVGERGEIVVRGPITMLGYWRRRRETAETLRGEWLRTGDLAKRDAEGFITLVGRTREMYISGGENVYPAEIEAVYAEHPDVRELAVVGVPDPRWGEVGHAYLVPRDETPPDAKALRAWGRERLADFKLPKRFVWVKALPRTASGKVQKHRLVDPRAD